jgi:hypothetical protein
MSSGVEYSTAIVFLCSDCGTAYKAVQKLTESKQLGYFDCSECNSLVHSWDEVYDYSAWTRIFVNRAARSRRLPKRLKMTGPRRAPPRWPLGGPETGSGCVRRNRFGPTFLPRASATPISNQCTFSHEPSLTPLRRTALSALSPPVLTVTYLPLVGSSRCERLLGTLRFSSGKVPYQPRQIVRNL